MISSQGVEFYLVGDLRKKYNELMKKLKKEYRGKDDFKRQCLWKKYVYDLKYGFLLEEFYVPLWQECDSFENLQDDYYISSGVDREDIYDSEILYDPIMEGVWKFIEEV